MSKLESTLSGKPSGFLGSTSDIAIATGTPESGAGSFPDNVISTPCAIENPLEHPLSLTRALNA